MTALPVLSLRELADDKPEALHALTRACSEDGFFYLVDHQLSRALINDCLEAAQRFFQLPHATKMRYGHARQPGYPPTARGYVRPYGETLHPAHGPDRKQHLDWGLDRPGGGAFCGPGLVPDDATAPGLTAAALSLQASVVEHIFPLLRRAIAHALDLPDGVLEAYFAAPVVIQRASYYPADGGSAGKHTDNGFLTVLIQQPLAQPSLQIFTQDRWRDVPCLDNALVINLGDMLQRWTAGKWVSTPHQVCHRQARHRVSLAFFLYPSLDAVISPLDGGADFNTQAMMLNNFDSIWQRGTGAGRAQELA